MPVPRLRSFELEEVHDAIRLNGTLFPSRDLTKNLPSRVLDMRYLIIQVVFVEVFMIYERIALLCLKSSVKVLRIRP